MCKILDVHGNHITFDVAKFINENPVITDVHFYGGEIKNLNFNNIQFINCRFTEVDIQFCSFTFCRFDNTIFNAVYLHQCEVNLTIQKNVNWFQCTFKFCDFTFSTLHDTRFQIVDVEFCSFDYCVTSDVELDFYTTKNSSFHRVAIEKADIGTRGHAVIAEILRLEADGDVEKQKVAAYIAQHTELCWANFLEMNDPNTEWAINVLKKYRRIANKLERYYTD